MIHYACKAMNDGHEEACFVLSPNQGTMLRLKMWWVWMYNLDKCQSDSSGDVFVDFSLLTGIGDWMYCEWVDKLAAQEEDEALVVEDDDWTEINPDGLVLPSFSEFAYKNLEYKSVRVSKEGISFTAGSNFGIFETPVLEWKELKQNPYWSQL